MELYEIFEQLCRSVQWYVVRHGVKSSADSFADGTCVQYVENLTLSS